MEVKWGSALAAQRSMSVNRSLYLCPMAKKNTHYVVWKGRRPGIYLTWNDCRAQVEGFAGALYKGFENRPQAEAALKAGPARPSAKPTTAAPSSATANRQQAMFGATASRIIVPSYSVDAAWNTMSGRMEYQGVETETKELIFHRGPYADGTNNVGEFLAIVHCLAWQKQQGTQLPIYTDSVNAMSWVRKRKHASKMARTQGNAILFELLERAEKWLDENPPEVPVLKWETKKWGENPADFGRK